MVVPIVSVAVAAALATGSAGVAFVAVLPSSARIAGTVEMVLLTVVLYLHCLRPVNMAATNRLRRRPRLPRLHAAAVREAVTRLNARSQ